LTGEADLGLATEAVDAVPGLASVPAFAWDHAVVVPLGHPLCQKERPGLADIARFPLITYGSDFAGGRACWARLAMRA
jgi:DNA-binding transcriptional LysR family regulator